MEIILVYLGDKNLPKYVNENINYLIQNFSEIQITFISDNPKNLRTVSYLGANTFKCLDYYKIMPKKYLDNIPDLNFRGGYWFLTLARFFAIEEYIRKFNLKNVLQLESDVLLMKNFPFYKLSKLKGLAFPLVNSGYGAASILYIENRTSISSLCKFAKEEIFKNPELTDMDILGSNKLTEIVNVTYLPTAFGEIDHFQNWVTKLDRKKLSSNVSNFGGIFDGMTWGQFLTGEDPRNHYGIRKLFRNQTHHSVLVDTYEIFFDNESLMVKDETSTFEIFCLHIHSKNKQYFDYNDHYTLLKNRISNYMNGQKKEIVWSLAIKFLPIRIKNKIKYFLQNSIFKKN